MSNEITTPEALDGLPVGSAVGRWYTDGSGPTVYAKCARGWEASGDGEGPYRSSSIIGDPLVLLYRPDRPSDLASTTDNLRAALVTAVQEGCGGCIDYETEQSIVTHILAALGITVTQEGDDR